MADTRMSVEERESFLADVHIGVLSIPRKERAAPLTVPVWYDYEPGGEAWLITGQQSLNGRLLEVGTPVALVRADRGHAIQVRVRRGACERDRAYQQ